MIIEQTAISSEMGISQVYYNSMLLNDADTCRELNIEADSELLLVNVAH